MVIHGDSFELMADVLAEAEKPVIVTDPPFNIGYHYDEYRDRKSADAYYAELAELLGMCPAVVVHYPEPLFKLAYQMGRFPERVLSWVYNSNTAKQHRDVAYFGIAPCFDGLGEYKNPTDKRIAARIAAGKRPRGYDWLYCNQVKNVSREKTEHPCQMPLEVMAYIVRTLPEDATIVDPFCGSGTTGVAAVQHGRRFVGIEISERYHAIAQQRIESVRTGLLFGGGYAMILFLTSYKKEIK